MKLTASSAVYRYRSAVKDNSNMQQVFERNEFIDWVTPIIKKLEEQNAKLVQEWKEQIDCIEDEYACIKKNLDVIVDTFYYRLKETIKKYGGETRRTGMFSKFLPPKKPTSILNATGHYSHNNANFQLMTDFKFTASFILQKIIEQENLKLKYYTPDFKLGNFWLNEITTKKAKYIISDKIKYKNKYHVIDFTIFFEPVFTSVKKPINEELESLKKYVDNIQPNASFVILDKIPGVLLNV